jgi:hypothetical protein
MDISSINQALELDRQKIDKEIQDAYEQVNKLTRQLKTRRNTLAYISRLPTEIISRIFTTLAHSSCMDHDSDLSWIRSVTAVCGHWRTIALECPNLWSIIVCSKPNWVGEMLKRSKMTPLIIKADDLKLTPNLLGIVRLALQHISRIRELHLAGSGFDLSLLLDPIDEPAPLLRSLCLSNTDDILGGEYELPETLFVCGGHHLHRLELTNCSILWKSPLLCGLIHFKFKNSSDVARIAVTQLLEVLGNMPLLETLDLEGLSFIASSDTKRAHLSRLTSLRLSSTTPEGARFLNHISFPASTSLKLCCWLDTVNDHSTVCDAVSLVWNGKDGSKLLRCLLIHSPAAGSAILQGWITNERGHECPSGPAQIDIELAWYDLGNRENDAIINLCNTLSLTDVRTLYQEDSDLSEVTLLNVFDHLTSLRTLHFNGWCAIELLSALSTRLEEKDNTGEIFLPSLHDLWLKGVNFEGTSDLPDPFGLLQDCLMTRCHWNAELQGLYLRECGLYPDEVNLLREIVVDVDWDGIGIK